MHSAGGVHFAFTSSVYHLLNEADTLRLSTALFRVLTPGGVAFGRTVGLAGDGSRARAIAAAATPEMLADPRLLTPDRKSRRHWHTCETLKQQLLSVGFTNVHVEEQNDIATSKPKVGDVKGLTTWLLFTAYKPGA